jgi:prepilin-type N-terminal cleavage/methylation domain-containing protein
MPTLPTNVRQALARRRGFTVIEMMAALAIVSILAALTVGAFTKVKSSVARRSMAADLYSQLALARNRARTAERMQIIVIDAAAGSNNTFGYFYFEDAATPPTLFSSSQLGALVTAMTAPPTVPAGYNLRLRDARTSSNNGYYLNADAWDGPLPIPWTPIAPTALNTSTSGCSFCSGGYGAIGFLPSGRVVFSDSTTLGGFIVLSGDAAGPTTSVRTGMGISPLGFVQQVEHP